MSSLHRVFRTLLGDHLFVENALSIAENLTSPDYTNWVVNRMKDVSQPTVYYGGIDQSHPEDHGTSQFTALDEQGNGVSATTTINRW